MGLHNNNAFRSNQIEHLPCWVKFVINPYYLSTASFLELMLLKRSKENTKCVSVAGEELTAAKHKLELKLFRDAAVAHMNSIELANVAEALRDADWVSAMQDELDQFARLKVLRLVPRAEGKTIIKTKWIFKNNKDESSLVIRYKARLVAV
nr:hypothetical protein [Tanacetum cinerariifolium]